MRLITEYWKWEVSLKFLPKMMAEHHCTVDYQLWMRFDKMVAEKKIMVLMN